jgi:primosomal protein N' (replication factor Y)
MTTFIQIVVNVPSMAGVFDYSVPERLIGHIGVGQLVVVPFGKQTVQGVILHFIDQPTAPKIKEIHAVVDPEPVLTHLQITLAESMAESTLSPLSAIIALFLPPGLSRQADTLFEIREAGNESFGLESISYPRRTTPDQSNLVSRLIKLLRDHGPMRGRQIDRALPHLEWRKTAQILVKRGTLASKSVLPPANVRPKFVRTAQLALRPENAEAIMPELGSTQATRTRRQKALRFLIDHPDAINVSWVYAESGCNLADLQELADRELLTLRETEIWRDPLEKIENWESEKRGLILTNEQENAWQKIDSGFNGKSTRKPFLLHGVTGSGKTELYLRAAQEAIRRGRQAIILVPEISLTPQTVRRFLARFPGQVGLIHSKLSDGERYDTWRRARSGQLQVIIGPRSALFAPLPNPGLIVLDECHDTSYYNSEPPFYNTVSAARTYAEICGGVCILGSATPSIVQHHQAEIGESIRLELTQRLSSEPLTESAEGLDLPPVHVVDLREELKAGNRSIFSGELIEALGQTLNRGEQAILFLNRRGTATYVFCRDCGHVMKCPRCDSPLTYHFSTGEKLLCHHCGYERQMPKKCPECGRTNIRAYGLGSEKVEAEALALFPKARTLRWDWETTRQKDAHEIILGHFASGRADVLVGTQMLSKGLDLPRVTLVGIILADVGLYLPDPFATERVFQVLTQVAGRAGRSSRGGKVVLQTFSPAHFAIQAAALHDVNGFYKEELAQRKRLGYPPYSQLARLEYRHYDQAKAEKEARALAIKLQGQLKAEGRNLTTLIGPVPCFFSKLDGRFRWQIVLRGADLGTLVGGRLSPDWRVETEPVSLL